MTGFFLLINRKSEMYNSILVIINWLTQIIYYKPVKVINYTLKLIEADYLSQNLGYYFAIFLASNNSFRQHFTYKSISK